MDVRSPRCPAAAADIVGANVGPAVVDLRASFPAPAAARARGPTAASTTAALRLGDGRQDKTRHNDDGPRSQNQLAE